MQVWNNLAVSNLRIHQPPPPPLRSPICVTLPSFYNFSPFRCCIFNHLTITHNPSHTHIQPSPSHLLPPCYLSLNALPMATSTLCYLIFYIFPISLINCCLPTLTTDTSVFCQSLVRNPVLRGSGLLHIFLSPGSELTGMFEPESMGREAGMKLKHDSLF